MSDTQSDTPSRKAVVWGLGLTQIMAWGSSYYLLTILAQPISSDMNVPLPWIVGGFSFALAAAGLAAPSAGRTIQRYGGRRVMASSSILLALGLASLSLSTSYAAFVASWIVMGLGMGSGLYDAAFATVGRLYGAGARPSISTVTLFGGFASTVCWPLSVFLLDHLGWRGACQVYAAIQLLIALPLHLTVIPPPPARIAGQKVQGSAHVGKVDAAPQSQQLRYVLLGVIVTLSASISAVVSIHLVSILQDRGLGALDAVALGTLIGPAQVGARVIERLAGQRHHPAWTMLTSTLLIFAGLWTLWLGSTLGAVALIAYGAGNGIHSIARGTVPLVLFDTENYARVMGTLAFPSLMAQALAPPVAALALGHDGGERVLIGVGSAALVNLVCAVALVRTVRGR